ncbi:hypothetical protein AcW1_005579 [Taiwanofungus camphoratus]|nr:hypothetical protein AcW2_004347 [Antrodia cinnamomea]KAI0948330.1 hypothetical protein AcV7_009110 [Antrodia cinnamomea]KAI0957074.1 hypothetical protein AcW1_005579 [Antrodia cinnamomea]
MCTDTAGQAGPTSTDWITMNPIKLLERACPLWLMPPHDHETVCCILHLVERYFFLTNIGIQPIAHGTYSIQADSCLSSNQVRLRRTFEQPVNWSSLSEAGEIHALVAAASAGMFPRRPFFVCPLEKQPQ